MRQTAPSGWTSTILIFILLFIMISWNAYCSSQCEARGGVWLHREQMCVSGIKRLP